MQEIKAPQELMKDLQIEKRRENGLDGWGVRRSWATDKRELSGEIGQT